MNRLSGKIAGLKKADKKSLILYLTAGDPNAALTERLMGTLAESGADLIELGLPFSDPQADGPVLQAAAERALAAGIVPDDVFALTARFRAHYDTPVALLVYYNQVIRYGLRQFCDHAAAAGVEALVVPDLTFEEAGPLEEEAEKHNLINVRFLSPTTAEKRLPSICRGARGFIYCVSVTGVTGFQAGIDPEMIKLLQQARRFTDLPLALGFGISTEAQAAKAADAADAVIVGSALIARLEECGGAEDRCTEAARFARSFKQAIAR